MDEGPQRVVAGSAVRRYCRARLAPLRGVTCADRLASQVVAQVTPDASRPFDRTVYRAAARAVDDALTERAPGERREGQGAAAPSSAARLAAALEELPAHVRDVIVLRTFVGLSREEVAGALGVSDLTVLRRQQEAIRRLRLEDL